jgi:hypothetical protein
MAWLNKRRWGSAALALALFTGSVPSFGQSAKDLDRARTLYRQGLSLEAAGDWAGALAKFEDVARVKLTPQVRYHIGRSKEQLGRLNEALGDYRLAEYEAQQADAKELAEITRARQELEARVPKLVITRGKGAESARIELDGVELGDARVGKEVNVDPGPHRIVAKVAAGSFEQTINVAERESKSVELVPPSDLGKQTAPPPPPSEPTAEAEVSTTPVETSRSPLPWIIGGVGAASLVASGVFYMLRRGAESDLVDGCEGDVCPERLRDTQDKGETYTTISRVTLGVGVVGIGVAVVWLATRGPAKPPEQPAQTAHAPPVDFAVSGGFTGVRLRGSF